MYVLQTLLSSVIVVHICLLWTSVGVGIKTRNKYIGPNYPSKWKYDSFWYSIHKNSFILWQNSPIEKKFPSQQFCRTSENNIWIIVGAWVVSASDSSTTGQWHASFFSCNFVIFASRVKTRLAKITKLDILGFQIYRHLHQIYISSMLYAPLILLAPKEL